MHRMGAGPRVVSERRARYVGHDLGQWKGVGPLERSGERRLLLEEGALAAEIHRKDVRVGAGFCCDRLARYGLGKSESWSGCLSLRERRVDGTRGERMVWRKDGRLGKGWVVDDKVQSRVVVVIPSQATNFCVDLETRGDLNGLHRLDRLRDEVVGEKCRGAGAGAGRVDESRSPALTARRAAATEEATDGALLGSSRFLSGG